MTCMSHQSELIATDIDAYLAQHERKELLRLLTCGSVDDGKSTLIGRLLYDSKMVYEDQLAAVRRDSLIHGTTGDDFDPALLTDGLRAEREQGITIDVAYRYFSTAKRKFIIADTPGHEQYTRNMATGASTCDLAVILIDARNGVVTQTRRHSFITSLLGIRHVLVAINKMDLVGFSARDIRGDQAGLRGVCRAPGSRGYPLHSHLGPARGQRGAAQRAHALVHGGTLMHILENVHIASDRNLIDFRFPVQYVNRPHHDFRGYCGTIASGIVRPGDEVMALPSQKTSRVRRSDHPRWRVGAGVRPPSGHADLGKRDGHQPGRHARPPGQHPADRQRFDAMVVWMDEQPLVPGKPYLIKHATKKVTGPSTTLRYRIDVNTLASRGLARHWL